MYHLYMEFYMGDYHDFPRERKFKTEPRGPRMFFHFLVQAQTHYLAQLELGQDGSWWVNWFQHVKDPKMRQAVEYAARFKRHPKTIIGIEGYRRWYRGDKDVGRGVHEAIRRHLGL